MSSASTTSAAVDALFPHPVRDAHGLLFHIEAVSLGDHLKRRAAARVAAIGCPVSSFSVPPRWNSITR